LILGYPFVAVMADTFSVERRKIIKAYGGKVILTPGAERGTGFNLAIDNIVSIIL
jgi:cysteine synthase A